VSRIRDFKDLICRALDRSNAGGSFDDVEKAVLLGEAQLWPGDKSAAITEPVTSLNVWLFAGDMAENAEMAVAAEAYARTLGYDQMTVTDPRKGWEKHLKLLGYEPQTIYVKGLKNG